MPDWEVAIIGRSYAGLSAALTLGRSRRHVLVIGDGPARNDPAPHAHGLLTRDHTAPAELLTAAERDLDRYETVLVERAHVDSVTATDDGFAVTFGDRSTTAGRVVLATGVSDMPPGVPGLADHWGNGVFTCPFCDGFEHADRPWGLISDHVELGHIALFQNWASAVTVFNPDRDGVLRRALSAAPADGLTLITRELRRIRCAGDDVVVSTDDGDVVLGALFVSGAFTPNSGLARQLGCELDDGFVRVDSACATSVPGAYAVGDVTRRGPHQIVLAAADGFTAAAAIMSGTIQDILRGRSSEITGR